MNTEGRKVRAASDKVINALAALKCEIAHADFMDALYSLQKAYVVEILKKLEVDYKGTTNSIYLWKAWELCRRYSLPLPEWVSEGLDDIAGEIIDEADSDREPKRISREGEVNQYRDRKKKRTLLDEYNDYLDLHDKLKITTEPPAEWAKTKLGADYGKKPRTIERWLQKERENPQDDNFSY